MKTELIRYTLRTSKVLLEKLGFIAKSNGRTKNKELEQIIKRHIQEYERLNGEIKINL